MAAHVNNIPLRPLHFAFDDATFSDRILVIQCSEAIEGLDIGIVEEPREGGVKRKDAPKEDIDVSDGVKKARLTDEKRENKEEESKLAAVETKEETKATKKKMKVKKTAVPIVVIEKKEVNNKTRVVELHRLHVSTLLLAWNSPFFMTMFKSGMQEGCKDDKNPVILNVANREEGARVLAMIKWLYIPTFETTNPAELLALLVTADQYTVQALIDECSRLLREQIERATVEEADLTFKLSNSILELPTTIASSLSLNVKAMILAAQLHLVMRLRNLDAILTEHVRRKEGSFNILRELGEEAMAVLLFTDRLEVHSENVVFLLLIRWFYEHLDMTDYKRMNQILERRLLPLVRIFQVTGDYLVDVVKPQLNQFPQPWRKRLKHTLDFCMELHTMSPSRRDQLPAFRSISRPRQPLAWDTKAPQMALIIPHVSQMENSQMISTPAIVIDGYVVNASASTSKGNLDIAFFLSEWFDTATYWPVTVHVFVRHPETQALQLIFFTDLEAIENQDGEGEEATALVLEKIFAPIAELTAHGRFPNLIGPDGSLSLALHLQSRDE